MFTKKIKIISGILLLSMLLAACGSFTPVSAPPQNAQPFPRSGGVSPRDGQSFPRGGMMGGRGAQSFSYGNYASNGERIYFTATNDKGEYISYSGGQVYGGGMMMGNYLACVSCHGADGRGGTHSMHMQIMDAPAIYYDALLEMKKEDSGGAPDEYSLDDLRGVVVEGHDTSGERLDPDMPRWQISDEDLADLLAYLETLP